MTTYESIAVSVAVNNASTVLAEPDVPIFKVVNLAPLIAKSESVPADVTPSKLTVAEVAVAENAKTTSSFVEAVFFKAVDFKLIAAPAPTVNVLSPSAVTTDKFVKPDAVLASKLPAMVF